MDPAILPPHVATSFRVALVEATAERMVLVGDQVMESMSDDLRFVLNYRGSIVIQQIEPENEEFLLYLSNCEAMHQANQQSKVPKDTDDLFRALFVNQPKSWANCGHAQLIYRLKATVRSAG